MNNGEDGVAADVNCGISKVFGSSHHRSNEVVQHNGLFHLLLRWIIMVFLLLKLWCKIWLYFSKKCASIVSIFIIYYFTKEHNISCADSRRHFIAFQFEKGAKTFDSFIVVLHCKWSSLNLLIKFNCIIFQHYCRIFISIQQTIKR